MKFAPQRDAGGTTFAPISTRSTSEQRKRRWPPTVWTAAILPARDQRVTVFAVTPNEVWVADPTAGIVPVVRNMRWAGNLNALLRVQR